MSGHDVPVADRLLSAIGARDFDAIAGCFADHALLRAVVPPGAREDVGPAEIAARFRRWLGEDGDFTVVDSEVTPFADLIRLRYVVERDDDELGRALVEQTGYGEIAGDRFVALRIACSGARPLA